MEQIPFSGNRLERARCRRSDSAWLEAQMPAGLFLPFWKNRPLVAHNRAAFLPWRDEWQGLTRVFLGLDGTQPFFALALGGDSEPSLVGGAFQESRGSAFVLPAPGRPSAGQAQ